jgi:hypothetical protein
VERSKEIQHPYQIIIATADFSEALRNEVNFIGKRYNHEEKTLDLPGFEDATT